jgi:uncharacterized protein YxeA
MKRILKTMASVLLIAAFAAMAVSCSKDDEDNNNNPLVGKWGYIETKLTYTVNNELFDVNISQNDYHTLVFNKNGSFEEKHETATLSGTYTVAGNKLTVYNNESEFVCSFNISESILDVIYPDERAYSVLRSAFGNSFEADDVNLSFKYSKIN